MECAAAIRAGATISSTARAPAATSASTGATAASMLGKWSQEIVVRRGWGTVWNTASAMKASVPSEPTSRRRKISSGEFASRKAQRRYPVVFLISNFRRTRCDSSLSARSSSRSSVRPRASSGSRRANSSSAPGAAVSIVVPEGSTKVSDDSVR